LCKHLPRVLIACQVERELAIAQALSTSSSGRLTLSSQHTHVLDYISHAQPLWHFVVCRFSAS
jgi:hypothetical protein